MASKTVNTRIQLKSDTEANWRRSVLTADGGEKTSGTSFVPLLGELIVYTADAAHPFSRLKVGDGATNVVQLPFIDAGSLNGETLQGNVILKFSDSSAFPRVGDENKLYIDLNKNRIFCFVSGTGYVQVSHFSNTVEKTTINTVDSWNNGTLSTATVTSNTLLFSNGTLPVLNLKSLDVVVNVKEKPLEVINNG